MEYVVGLAFDEKPDYEKCRNILRDGLRARGYRDDGKLVFMSATPVPPSRKTKSRLPHKVSKRKSEEIAGEDPEDEEEEVEAEAVPVSGRVKRAGASTKRAKRAVSAGSERKEATPDREKENTKNKANVKVKGGGTRGRKTGKSKPSVQVTGPGIDNPTPQMLALMKKKMES